MKGGARTRARMQEADANRKDRWRRNKAEADAYASTNGFDILEYPKNQRDLLRGQCRCDEKHVFEATLPQIARMKDRCPGCKQARTRNMHETHARSMGGRILEYHGTGKPALYECIVGHQWQSKVHRITGEGHWCPACSTMGRTTEIAAENGYVLIEYNGSREHCVVRKDERDFYKSPKNVTGSPYVRPLDAPRPYHVHLTHNGVTGLIHINECHPHLQFALGVTETAVLDEAPTKAIAMKIMESKIEKEDVDLINVRKNPNWIAPGVYSWGLFTPLQMLLDEWLYQ